MKIKELWDSPRGPAKDNYQAARHAAKGLSIAASFALSVYATQLDAGLADLRVANRTKNDSTAVKNLKSYLMHEDGRYADSLILDKNGSGIFINVLTDVKERKSLPRSFDVSQNYPNPFNPSTRMDVSISSAGPLDCYIYSTDGRLVRAMEAEAEPGEYVIDWKGENDKGKPVAKGVYFARIISNNACKSVKMVNFGGGGGTSGIYGVGEASISAAMQKNALVSGLYKIRFADTDSTQPKIKEWTTGLFGVSGNMDTTFYSDAIEPPAAPTNMTAEAVSPKQVNISWTDNATTETGYDIKRKQSDSTVTIAKLPANSTSYTDTAAMPFTNYTYYATATDSINKLQSQPDSVSVQTPDTPPSKPSLTATSVSWKEVDLAWTPSDKETEYRVMKGTEKGVLQEVATLPKNQTSYSDTANDLATNYFYAVLANNKNAWQVTSSDTQAVKTKDAMVKVYGSLIDAYTKGALPGIPIDVKCKNNTTGDSSMVQAITDSLGRYVAELDLAKGINYDIALQIVSDTLYNYLEKAGIKSRADIKDALHDIVDFARYVDPLNANSSDERKDLLKWLMYMHMPAWQTDEVTFVAHWRAEDHPLNVNIDTVISSPKDSEMAITQRGITMVEAKLGHDEYQEISSQPSTGLKIVYGSGLGNTTYEWAYDSTGSVPLYPVKGQILLPLDSLGNPRFFDYFVTHELLQDLLGMSPDSPLSNHNTGYPIAKKIADFEARAVKVLENLPETYQKKYKLSN